MPKEKEVFQINPQLAENLRVAKVELDAAKKKVEAAEIAIYNAAEPHLPEKGTVHVTGVKIATGYTEKWDQAQLAEIETTWPRKSNSPFPFKKEFKADGKSITYMKENAPESYSVLEPALTITPKKPVFTLEGED